MCSGRVLEVQVLLTNPSTQKFVQRWVEKHQQMQGIYLVSEVYAGKAVKSGGVLYFHFLLRLASLP